MTSKLVNINIQLPKKLRDDFKRYAKSKDMDVSKLVREFMRKQLNK